MTGYTVHTGASKKFVAGWDSIFGGGKTNTADDVNKTTAKPAKAKNAATKDAAKAEVKPEKKKANKASKKKKK